MCLDCLVQATELLFIRRIAKQLVPVLGFPDFESCVAGLMAEDPDLTKDEASAICASAEETISVMKELGVTLTDEQVHGIYIKELKRFKEHESEPPEPDNPDTPPDNPEPEPTEPDPKPEPAPTEPEPTPEPPADMKYLINKKKHSLNHKFSWPVPMLLEPGDEEAMMLFKGVAMQEGDMKRGEVMEKDNLIFATGAMSAAAMLGVAMMDIDHYETGDQLPAKYLEKYGKELADPYPPAFIIDAMVEENITEPSGKKVNQVEFLAACTNPLVYQMIKAGKFKGCSVVDYYRKEVCEDCLGTDGTCNCTIEGSHFLMNTFILEEVPNSNGTWVEVLTEKDIGTIIERPSAQLVEQLKIKAIKDPRMRMKTFLLQANIKRHSEYDLEQYMDTETGQWKDGKSSIISFLMDEKSMPETTANDMAEYLWTHPDALNQYQYENMSAEDLIAWFRHITEKAIQAKIYQMQKQLAALSALQHNADGLKTLKNLDQLGKDEVNYGPGAEGVQCQECRWFFAMDPNDMPGPGMCALVSGDILGTDTCDRFEAAPGGGGDPAPTEGEPAAEHPEPVEPNEDGSCNEGWELNEDTGMCEKVGEKAQEEPIAPDLDGNCPDGWELQEIDGTPMCVMPQGVPAQQKNRLVKNALVWKLYKKSTKPTVGIEKKPQVALTIVRKQYLERIAKIDKDIKDVGIIIGTGHDSMNRMAKLNSLKNERVKLELILKKN